MEPTLSQVIGVFGTPQASTVNLLIATPGLRPICIFAVWMAKTYWKTAKKRLAFSLPQKKMAIGKRSLLLITSICLRVKA